MANLKAGATIQGFTILHAGNFDAANFTALKGDQGDKGDQGTGGQKGDTGTKGDGGSKGPQGAKGDQGSGGDKGPAGTPGVAGQPVTEIAYPNVSQSRYVSNF